MQQIHSDRSPCCWNFVVLHSLSGTPHNHCSNASGTQTLCNYKLKLPMDVFRNIFSNHYRSTSFVDASSVISSRLYATHHPLQYWVPLFVCMYSHLRTIRLLNVPVVQFRYLFKLTFKFCNPGYNISLQNFYVDCCEYRWHLVWTQWQRSVIQINWSQVWGIRHGSALWIRIILDLCIVQSWCLLQSGDLKLHIVQLSNCVIKSRSWFGKFVQICEINSWFINIHLTVH